MLLNMKRLILLVVCLTYISDGIIAIGGRQITAHFRDTRDPTTTNSTNSSCTLLKWSVVSRFPFGEAVDCSWKPPEVVSWALVDVSSSQPAFVAGTASYSLKLCGRNVSALRLYPEVAVGGGSTLLSVDSVAITREVSADGDSSTAAAVADGLAGQAAVDTAAALASAAGWLPYSSVVSGGIVGSGSLISAVGYYRSRASASGVPLKADVLHWGSDALGLSQGVWPPRAFVSEADGCHAFFVTRGGAVAGWGSKGGMPTQSFGHLPQTRVVSAPAVDASCGLYFFCSITLADGSWISGSFRGPNSAAPVRPGAFANRLTAPVAAVTSLYSAIMCFQYAAANVSSGSGSSSSGGDVVCSGGYNAASNILPISSASADIYTFRSPGNATLLVCGSDACCSVGPGDAGGTGSTPTTTSASADSVWCWGGGMGYDYNYITTARPVPIPLPAGSGKRVLKVVAHVAAACVLIATNGSNPGPPLAAAGTRDGVAAGATVSSQGSTSTAWWADTVASAYDGGAVYCWGKTGQSRIGTSGNPDKLPPTRVAVPPVLDIQCILTGCTVLAVGGNTGVITGPPDDPLDWSLWVWGTTPYLTYPRVNEALAPVRLSDPAGILRGLASLTGPRRLNCNRAFCALTSPIGFHLLGAGFTQLARSLPPGTTLPFTISRDAPTMAYDGVSPFGPASAALALRTAEASRMTYAAVGTADGSLAVKAVDNLNGLGLLRYSATNLWQPHSSFAAAGLRLAQPNRTMPGQTTLSGAATGFVALASSGDVFAVAPFSTGGRISPGNVPFVSVDASYASNFVVRLAIAADGAVWLQGNMPEYIFTANMSAANIFNPAASALFPTPLLPAVTSACYMSEGPTLCASFANGSIACTGRFPRNFGLIGLFGMPESLADNVFPFVPAVGLPANVSFIRCKNTVVCVLLGNGTVFCGGTDGGRGRLGAGNAINAVNPSVGSGRWLRVLIPEPVVDVCNVGFAAAVTTSGSVYVWGDGSSTPRRVNLPVPAARVSCGDDSIAIVAVNGSVWGVGANPDLFMSETSPPVPDPVPTLRQSAFRSAASLHEGGIASLKFGPSAHAGVPIDNPLHACHRLPAPSPALLQSVNGSVGSAQWLAGGYACAASSTAVWCWSGAGLTFAPPLRVPAFALGGGIFAGSAPAMQLTTAPLLPTLIPSLSYSVGNGSAAAANATAASSSAGAITALHCTANGVLAQTTTAVRVAVSSTCSAAIPMPSFAVPAAGTALLALQQQESLLPPLWAVLAVAQPPLVVFPADGAATAAAALASAPATGANNYARGAPADSFLVAWLFTQASSNSTCSRNGTVALALPGSGGSELRRITAFAAGIGASGSVICAAAIVRIDGTSRVWCGEPPSAAALLEAAHAAGLPSGADGETAGPLAGLRLPWSTVPVVTATAAVSLLIWSPSFGLCPLLTDGRVLCERDPSPTAALLPWAPVHYYASSAAASTTGALCVTTTAMTVQCMGNNSAGEAGLTAARWLDDNQTWIPPSAAVDVPEVAVPPRAPEWHSARILSSSCAGDALYGPRSFALTGCPAGVPLQLNFTGGGPFPAGTRLHLHASAASFVSAPLLCNAGEAAARGTLQWCAATLPALPDDQSFAAGFLGLTLQTSYVFNGTTFRSCFAASAPTSAASDVAAATGLPSCMDRSSAPLVLILTSALAAAAPGAPTGLNAACAGASAACPAVEPAPAWNASARLLSGISGIRDSILNVSFPGVVPALASPLTADAASAAAASAGANLTLLLDVWLERAPGERYTTCTNASVALRGAALRCVIPPALGAAGPFRLFASFSWADARRLAADAAVAAAMAASPAADAAALAACSGDISSPAANASCVDASVAATAASASLAAATAAAAALPPVAWAALLLGSETVAFHSAVWAVSQPLPALPTGGGGSVGGVGNASVIGAFTALSLLTRPQLVWRYAVACGAAATVVQEAERVSPNVLTVRPLPGFSLLRLQAVTLQTVYGTVNVPVSTCTASAALPDGCALRYATPVVLSAAAIFVPARSAYAVDLVGRNFGTLPCTPLALQIEGRSVTVTSSGSDNALSFEWQFGLTASSRVVVGVPAGGPAAGLPAGATLINSDPSPEVVIDAGCAPSTICGVGVGSAAAGGLVSAAIWQQGDVTALTVASAASASIAVQKRAGAPLYPPLRIALVDVGLASAVPPSIVLASARLVGDNATRTTCSIGDGARGTRSVTIAPGSGASGGVQLDLPATSDALLASAPLPVECTRDGSLRVTLPPVRVTVVPLAMSLAMPLVSSGGIISRGNSNAGNGSTANGSIVASASTARTPQLTSGSEIWPPIAVSFPAPSSDDALPLSQPPCNLALSAFAISSPVAEPRVALTSAVFVSNGTGSSGVFVARGAALSAVPGTLVQLQVSCAVASRQLAASPNEVYVQRPESAAADHAAEDAAEPVPHLPLPLHRMLASAALAASVNISIAPCGLGDFVRPATLTCAACGNGTFSLFPLPDTSPEHACVPCADAPISATASAGDGGSGGSGGSSGSIVSQAGDLWCPHGGSYAYAKTGYWRASASSLVAVRCKPAAACDELATGPGLCMPGYAGRACSRCADGFGRRGEECVACPSDARVGGLVTAMLSLLLTLTLALTCWARLSTLSYLDAVEAVRRARAGPADKIAGTGSAGANAGDVVSGSSPIQRLASSALPANAIKPPAPGGRSAMSRVIAAPLLLLDHVQGLQVASSLPVAWPAATAALLSLFTIIGASADAGYIIPPECAAQALLLSSGVSGSAYAAGGDDGSGSVSTLSGASGAAANASVATTGAGAAAPRSVNMFIATQYSMLALPFILLALAAAFIGLWGAAALLCSLARCKCCQPCGRGAAPLKGQRGDAASGVQQRPAVGVARIWALIVRVVSAALRVIDRAGPFGASDHAAASSGASSSTLSAGGQLAQAAAATAVQSSAHRPAAGVDIKAQLRIVGRWALESCAAAAVATSYVMHSTLTQRLAVMLACTIGTDVRVLPLPPLGDAGSLSGDAVMLATATVAAQAGAGSFYSWSSPPSWRNVTSSRLTGGAWLVTERALYTLSEQSLLCGDAALSTALIPAFAALVLGIPAFIAAALHGRLLSRCGVCGAAVRASSRALLARDMRRGRRVWPVAVMLRKAGVIVVLVVLGPWGPVVQLTAGVALTLLALAGHMQARPAQLKALNGVGALSQLAIGITLSAGLLVASGQLSTAAIDVVGGFAVAANVAFIASVVSFAAGVRGRSACARVQRRVCCGRMFCCGASAGSGDAAADDDGNGSKKFRPQAVKAHALTSGGDAAGKGGAASAAPVISPLAIASATRRRAAGAEGAAVVSALSAVGTSEAKLLPGGTSRRQQPASSGPRDPDSDSVAPTWATSSGPRDSVAGDVDYLIVDGADESDDDDGGDAGVDGGEIAAAAEEADADAAASGGRAASSSSAAPRRRVLLPRSERMQANPLAVVGTANRGDRGGGSSGLHGGPLSPAASPSSSTVGAKQPLRTPSASVVAVAESLRAVRAVPSIYRSGKAGTGGVADSAFDSSPAASALAAAMVIRPPTSAVVPSAAMSAGQVPIASSSIAPAPSSPSTPPFTAMASTGHVAEDESHALSRQSLQPMRPRGRT